MFKNFYNFFIVKLSDYTFIIFFYFICCFQPDNILIGYDGRYKIGDLGLMASKRGFAGATTTKNEYREGDNRYMAPETLQGVFTSRADVFSLGMTVLCVICDIELPKNGEMWHKVIVLLKIRVFMRWWPLINDYLRV